MPRLYAGRMISIRAFLAVILLSLGAAFVAQAATAQPVRVQVVNERGLPVSDAVVEIRSNKASAGSISFPWPMAMAQKNQEFTPGTLIVARGSTVAFPNLDRVRHSIYSFSKAARFEIDLYGRDQTRSHRFPIVGSVKLGCNIHDNMRGYIRVTDTPFAAKTDRNGYVTISGLPTGAAKLTVWHPMLRAPANEVSKPIAIGSDRKAHKVEISLR